MTQTATSDLDPPAPALTVVVPVMFDSDEIGRVHAAYRDALSGRPGGIEFIYVLDGEMPRASAALRTLHAAGEPIQALAFNQSFGEAAALSVGFRHARGATILTAPSFFQVDPDELPRFVDALNGTDMLIARRAGGKFGRGKLEKALSYLLQSPFEDVRCGLRVFRREVTDEIKIYGHQHRFLPLFALRHGFAVKQLEVRPGSAPPIRQTRSPLDLSLLLDVIAVFFLLKFVRRPFRFFGGIGMGLLALGAVVTLWLVIDRLFLGTPLADRPALVLSTLMIVLGIQVIAVGLIGEIVTFAYTKDMRDYRIDKIID